MVNTWCFWEDRVFCFRYAS